MDKKEKIICSVIILSYNTKEITSRCLKVVKESLDYSEKKLGKKVEVVVVENGSADGSLQMIRNKYGWVKLMTPGENTGFAKGNNLGMKQAKGSYFLLLNSDAIINKETIVLALDYLKNHPACDVLGCRLTFEDGRFQASAGFLPTLLNVFSWMVGIDKVPLIRNGLAPFHPNHPLFFAKDKCLGWITGAFMFLKREVFEKTGGFDERYFLYAEEVEWCQRMIEVGFKICFTPSFSVVHLKAASSQFDSKTPLIKEIEGVLYFFKKHYPEQLFLVRLIFSLGSLVRLLAFTALVNKEKSQAYLTILKEKIWKKLPS